MRLIDADKIINSLGSSDVDLYISGLIDEQPTAFDVDKVIRQIKDVKEKKDGACIDVQCELCDYYNDCGEIDMSYKLALDKAIEIVKGGGVQ